MPLGFPQETDFATRKAALEILIGILQRIKDSPTDERFRRIRRSSATFQRLVGSGISGLDEFLTSAGFCAWNNANDIPVVAGEPTSASAIFIAFPVRAELLPLLDQQAIASDAVDEVHRAQAAEVNQKVERALQRKRQEEAQDQIAMTTLMKTQVEGLTELEEKLVALLRRWIDENSVAYPDWVVTKRSVEGRLAAGSAGSDSTPLERQLQATLACEVGPTMPEDKRRCLRDACAAVDAEMFERHNAHVKAAPRRPKVGKPTQQRDGPLLPAELQLTATGIINDIGSLAHQVSVLRGDTGMVREDRKLMQELLEDFQKSGDIARLHATKDEWEDRLAEEKRVRQRSLVFLQ